MLHAGSVGTRPAVTVVLGTGGTIAGRAAQAGDHVGYVAGTVSVADLLAGVPALRDLPLHRLEQKVAQFFAARSVDMLSLTPADFIAVVRLAVKQPLLESSS